MTSTGQTQPLVDALRARIADPGAFLPRHTPSSGGFIETIASWGARAVAAGLADGSLGVKICSALCVDVERDRDDYEGQLGDMRAALSAAEAEVDRLATIVDAARAAAQRLLNQEQENCGSGRDGHLNEDDLVPLLEALGTRYLDGDTDGLITAPARDARRAQVPVAVNGCDDCSVEPGETHRYAGCPGVLRAFARTVRNPGCHVPIACYAAMNGHPHRHVLRGGNDYVVPMEPADPSTV